MRQGVVERDGIAIAYEVGGAGDPAICLLPPWMIVDRRIWKALSARLRGCFRVVSYDARGNGASDRPDRAEAYEVGELVADALAVLDATGARRAVLVGNSLGGLVGYLIAALHPERVAGLVLVGATVNLEGDDRAPFVRALARFEEDLGTDQGWARYNRHSWRRDYQGFVEWFLDIALADGGESAEGRADGIAAALATTPDLLAATVSGRSRVPAADQAAMLSGLAPRISCPVLVIHGDRDAVIPPAWGRVQAETLAAEHVVIPDAGHCPQVTHPAQVAALIEGFTARAA